MTEISMPQQLDDPHFENKTPRKFFQEKPMALWLGIVALFIMVGAAAYTLGVTKGENNLSTQVSENSDSVSLLEPTPTPAALPVIQPTATPSSSVSLNTSEPKPSPTPSPSPSAYPQGWKEHSFPQVGVKLAAPAHWKADYQYFQHSPPHPPSHLIRFWQGSTPDTATIQFTITSDWGGSDWQYLPRQYPIGSGLMALKFDPPAFDEEKLDRYQTLYIFETENVSYYALSCVHNWIEEQYQLCETMLKTGTFK